MFIRFVVILFMTILVGFLLPDRAQAIDAQETLAYKLAVMQTNALDPARLLLEGNAQPPQAVVAEFQWILDSLRPHCLNPDTALADTMVEVWRSQSRVKKPRSLLETARELAKVATATARRGNEKVNFRMTSRYWLAQQFRQENIRQSKTSP